MSADINAFVEDIFNVPRNGKNIADDTDEEDLGLSTVTTSVSFEEKAKEVAEALVKTPAAPPAVQAPEKTIEKTKESTVTKPNSDVEEALRKTVQPPPAPVLEKKPTAATPSPTLTSNDLFSDDDVQPTSSPKPKAVEPKPQPKVEAPKVAEPKQAPKVEPLPTPKPASKSVKAQAEDVGVDEELINDDTKSVDAGPCEQWKAGEEWLLESPAPKYDRLYREKKIALTPGPNSILKGGQLDFDKIYDELAELNVDVTVKTYNPQDIHDKMQLVQQLRTRLEHIRLKISRQYHMWERYIELFHGILCRTEYDRGKQEGLNYDHLRDMEHYFCSIKSLYKSSDGIMRTLDGAFECLSRQVTIVLPMKEIERFGPSSGSQVTPTPRQQPSAAPSAPKPMTPALRKFDSLGDTTKTAPKSPSPDGEGEGLPSSWAL